MLKKELISIANKSQPLRSDQDFRLAFVNTTRYHQSVFLHRIIHIQKETLLKMKLTKSLATGLKEVLTEGKWVIGTNIKEQITDLNWKEAVQKIDSLNSIADLTFHISYYIAGVSNVLEGGTLDIRDKYSFEYPPIKSEDDWKNLITKFCSDSERFIALIEKMDEDKLYQPFFDAQYGNYLKNVNAIMEHAYYHFGQIVIIKKMIRGKKS